MVKYKASLGVVAGASGDTSKPKVILYDNTSSCLIPVWQVEVLTLELGSPTLPPGKEIIFNLSDIASLADTKKNPIIIKEGVEYKSVLTTDFIAILILHARSVRITFFVNHSIISVCFALYGYTYSLTFRRQGLRYLQVVKRSGVQGLQS